MTGQGGVHFIVTCTRRKTVPAGDALFPEEREAGKAYVVWLGRLAQAVADPPHDRPALEQGSCRCGA